MMLEMRGVCKAFDSNRALDNVDFCVREGSIHALIGENGAGKSTLMNILGGVLAPDAGEIRLLGRPVAFRSPRESMDAGVAFIHQELNLITDLRVFENMFIGREIKTKRGLLDEKTMCARSAEVFERMGIALSPRALVKTLDASYKQIVEIARALLMNARLIIMDEPTTSLTEVEINFVFTMMRTLAKQGVAIVFISHKLGEVLSVCDAYTVLRDGRAVESGAVADVTAAMLARAMVGHAVRTERLQSGAQIGPELLRGEGLAGAGFRNVSFTLHAGEILGFTGLLGDGRSELFRAVFGAEKLREGRVFIGGKPARIRSTDQARALGLGYVPRDRKENGIIKDMSILDNATLVTLRAYRGADGLIRRKKQRAAFESQRKALHIKLADARERITSLSGGNQQKAVLAKWLLAAPRVMIFDNPTQGVDVGAKEEIYDIILRLSAQGVGVIVLSSEAQEIIRLCSRAVVMYHGSAAGEVQGDAMTEHNIMLLAAGGKGE